MQEVSSFNPLLSQYEDFTIETADTLLSRRGTNTSIGGALAVFHAAAVAVIPTISARAPSTGVLSSAGWKRLADDFTAAVAPHAGAVDAVYLSLHGAMASQDETDPEGFLLERMRELFGHAVPIVISLDLHGIATDRMLRQVDGVTVYKTYPHTDFSDTGVRAARLLLDIVKRDLSPVIARVVVPMLARGDECVTRNGLYGDVLGEALLLERSGQALAAAVMIGNPFTDVPELCTQALVVCEQDDGSAERAAASLAGALWEGRHRLVAKLVDVDKAVALAGCVDGPVIFTDAADATSSGASGDSNVLIRALRKAGYGRRVLAHIVDAPAAQAAHTAGVGAEIDVALGGSVDPHRFQPMAVRARVESLSAGRAILETMRLPIDAGLSAVLTFDNFTVLAITKPAFLFDRSLYFANGLDPRHFDLVVVKSPHTEFHMYEQWAARNFNVDAPGSTSANVRSLGHRLCGRPIYPLDPETTFTPRAVTYHRRQPDRLRSLRTVATRQV
ncbi:MAG: M81 family metallopeptidase [Rhizobiaceae bacterium]|nr:M81 family metallopeptidase [Rhizobiaceae bacterium]